MAKGKVAVVYSVKEAFLTLQGEGFNAGRTAVFCRFSGCNLWTGRESDRFAARCTFCDTDFVGSDGVGGGKYASSHALADHLKDLWTAANQKPLVVFTGGEPLLQLDSFLIQDVQARGFEVAVETNGTIQPPAGINWLTVSPKGSVPLRVRTGQELKLVYPQFQSSPETFECLAFEHFFLQPLDDDDLAHHTRAAVDYCLGHPKWRLSVQMHKFAGFR